MDKGGRLASDDVHLGDLYEFEFETLTWTKLEPSLDDRPSPRYFHSADYCMLVCIQFNLTC
jgi:hypothetical protein